MNVNLTLANQKFAHFARTGKWEAWHPMGTGIPKFSKAHCSTGTALLTEALLVCDSVKLYGYHVCDCETKCSRGKIADYNHYWDTAPTTHFDKMAQRYSSHMRFYHKLQTACDLDFKIARLDHCDRLPKVA
mmetsp:Transcript_20098/g.63511  ORF Transcript_20098/g.63511 Transcript_20098/m.63511 type:complete len:131 (+) Transcript_20098:2-394(+)